MALFSPFHRVHFFRSSQPHLVVFTSSLHFGDSLLDIPHVILAAQQIVPQDMQITALGEGNIIAAAIPCGEAILAE